MPATALRILGSLLAICLACAQKQEAASPPPPDVTVVETRAQEVPIYREFVGQVFGFKDIAIRARVEGYLEGIHFREGSRVEKGDLLYTVESQPFEAEVAAKMSGVAEAETALAKAKSDLNRIRPLARENAVSQSDLDSAVALYEASVAGVKAAEANLKAARIQLGYTRIHAPISGIIGRTQAKVGDFVGREPNPVILNTVSDIDPVLVQFFITETDYLEAARGILAGTESPRKDEARQGLQMILSDGSVYRHRGRFDFADREVDPATGAMMIQASFPNPDGILRPGQFARVKARVDVVDDGILVPQRCVTELQGTYSVYVVGDDDTAHRRTVTVGPKVGSTWLITEGLEPGERVVYEGIQRLREGTRVRPTVHEEEPSPQGVLRPT